MRIIYSYKAAGQLTSLDVLYQIRIAEKMRFFAQQPNPLLFAKYITTRNLHCFRVGSYRVYFKLSEGILYITTIERRDKAYKK